MARVVGTEAVEDARRRGRVVLEILPGDIVTEAARESAARLGLRLADGPVEREAPARADGEAAARRALYRRAARPGARPRPAPGGAAGTAGRGRRFAKIALVGAGGVGANVAHLAAAADMAEEIALVDVAPGLAAATAMDLNHARGITGAGALCVGGEEAGLVAGAELVLVSAGRARSPGMARAELAGANARVVRQAAEAIRTQAPDAVVVVVTNPLDEMTAEMLRATGFPRERVLGMAGTLDGSRFRNALATAAGVPPGHVEAVTLGSHGDEMVPIASRARIRGAPLDKRLSAERIADCVREAVTGGGQVVALKRSGSAIYAPAHACVELLDHVRGARQGPVPVTVMLDGEFGIEGVALTVPAHLGRGGLVRVEEFRISEDERAALGAAAEAIRARLAS